MGRQLLQSSRKYNTGDSGAAESRKEREEGEAAVRSTVGLSEDNREYEAGEGTIGGKEAGSTGCLDSEGDGRI